VLLINPALFTVGFELCIVCCSDILYGALYFVSAGTKKKSSSEGKAFVFRVGKGLVIRGVSLYPALLNILVC